MAAAWLGRLWGSRGRCWTVSAMSPAGCCAAPERGVISGRRSGRTKGSLAAGGALGDALDRDAHLAGLVGQVLGDAGAREDDDPDRQGFQHRVVALEGRSLGVAR